MPPVNRSEPEDGDERRISAEQALAPVAPGPACSRPPGAHIGDESERRAKIISFANQKGGVAKTTTTLNLAVAFAESGHRVLGHRPRPAGQPDDEPGHRPRQGRALSMYDVLVDHIPIRDVIQQREIDIAVASIDLAGAEIAMSMQIGRERSLEKALSAVVDDYDFVCIDTPPSLGLLTVNALTASDKVIVPVQCEYLSMRGLVQLQNTLEMIRENLNPRVHIEGILPTMLDSRTVHAKEAVEILEENFGELVFKSRIRKAIKFAEAPGPRLERAQVRSEGQRRQLLPRPGQGGPDEWRVVSGPACARARSPTSSAPRAPGGRGGAAHGAAAVPEQEAPEQPPADEETHDLLRPRAGRSEPGRRAARGAASRRQEPEPAPPDPERVRAYRVEEHCPPIPAAEGAAQPDLRRRVARRGGPHVRPRRARHSATTTGRRARTCP